ncbi:MAG TPA: M20/M25/M40 family metallo-hydrolase [Candidatus Acidoferrales bacterium]|nr:M20/M25/M40 family metallo-hydrolase [Candidatus Acidoferrales bacterium]
MARKRARDGGSVDSQQDLPGGRTLFIGLLLYALLIGLTALFVRPPAAKPADAPASEFSGTRAKQVLQQLVGDGVPHPVGSAADAVVRERIVAELNRLGYQPKIETNFACDEWGTCAEAKNVVARLDGQQPGPSVMMASHYDSVPAGPGASDDGAGVAAELEIARALKASPPLRHPVILLIDEGEEAGLLGAEAFVANDPWESAVFAVVNVEARGTSGPSSMFETGSANRWLMGLYADSVPHPHTTSIDYTVYKLLPNDTDFTVFKRPGVAYQGFNFAFIGDVAHYHTPDDNVANADARSIQQQGESALATLRALANSDSQPDGESEAVFFDLFGWKTIWWPAGWTIGLAGFALVLLVVEIGILLRRGTIRLREFVFGLASWPLALFAAILIGGIAYFLLRRAGALPVSWVAHLAPLLIAFWALGFGADGIVAATIRQGAGFRGLWSGTWIWWAIVASVLAMRLPGLSYVFLLPALTAAICGVWILFGKKESMWRWRTATLVPAVVTGIVGFAVVWFLYDALGGIVLTGIAVLIALLATPLVPLAGNVSGRRRWVFPAVAAATFVLSLSVALAMPVHSTSSPERMNFDYYQDAGRGKSYWLATPNSGQLPKSLLAAASFSDKEEAVQPLIGNAYVARAPNLNLQAPSLTVESVAPSQEKLVFRVSLRSPRGAPETVLAFPADSGVESVSMNGHAMGELSSQVLRYTHGWRAYVCETLPSDGIEMQFTLPSPKPVTILLLDKSFGLPLEGMFLEKARPDNTIASQDGDVTIVSKTLLLKQE